MAVVGEGEDWRHTLYVAFDGQPQQLVPDSGIVRISIVEAGDRVWYDGNDFTSATPVDLDTSIVDKASVLDFTIPSSAADKTIRFRGEATIDGVAAPLEEDTVNVEPETEAVTKLNFGGDD